MEGKGGGYDISSEDDQEGLERRTGNDIPHRRLYARLDLLAKMSTVCSVSL